MNYEDLTAEQKARVRAAKTPEELLQIARDEGYELSDDELETISGGSWGGPCKSDTCPDQDIGY